MLHGRNNNKVANEKKTAPRSRAAPFDANVFDYLKVYCAETKTERSAAG